MGINRGRLLHKAKIYAAVFMIFTAIIIDNILVYQVETEKRAQGVFNVQHAISCMGRFERAVGTLEYNGMKTCADDMRTSITGDMFLLNYDTKEFLYDGSKDIPSGQKLYFTEDSIGKYFKDWKSAEYAMKFIGSGVDSIPSTRVSYNYDGREEWLEYKTFTPATLGSRVIVVQGIQSDEALSGYSVVRNSAKTLVGVYAMWLLSTGISGRRNDCT